MPDETKRILVAEDNAALALVVRFHLEQAGFQVTVARNGLEAWHALHDRPFDLLVTDQQMPEMSGCELCKRVRSEPSLAETPIIMLTAKGLEMELSSVCEELGLRAILPKPFSVRQVVEMAEECLTPVGQRK